MFLLAIGCSTPQEPCKVEPVMFCAPFKELERTLPDSAKQELLAMPKSDYIQLHFGLGMEVRNQLDLWGDNEITRFFTAHGVDHPDDMSMPFIGGFVDYLRGENVDMVKAMETYGMRLPPPPPPEPDPS